MEVAVGYGWQSRLLTKIVNRLTIIVNLCLTNVVILCFNKRRQIMFNKYCQISQIHQT